MNKIKSLFTKGICLSLLALTFIGCQQNGGGSEDVELFKIGTEKIYDFSDAIVFDKTQVSDFKIEADGSVTYVANGQYSGGGACFYIKPDQSIINIENYESIDVEYEYEPVSGKWNSADNPKWCFNVYSDDSSGFWSGGNTVEYIEEKAFKGSFKHTVRVGASLEGDMKAFALKLNTYNTKNESSSSACKVRIKKVTFNKKAGAPEDAPSDDGLTDEQRGKIIEIKYPTKDYLNNGTETYEKPARVYLPAGFNADDKDTKYPVLFLMHGVQGYEGEWGMTTQGKGGKLKGIMDKEIAAGNVKKFIVVCPNGRSSSTYSNSAFENNQGFYKFGQELRNDLLPYMQKNYNVDTDRKNIAMAGLSMGGMQTINIGLCECLDIMSYFGAFSAAPTTYTAAEIKTAINKFDSKYDIKYFYNICKRGTLISSCALILIPCGIIFRHQCLCACGISPGK